MPEQQVTTVMTLMGDISQKAIEVSLKDIEQCSKSSHFANSNEEEKTTSETRQDKLIQAEKTMDSQSLFQTFFAGQINDSVPVTWAGTSTLFLRAHAKGNPLPNARGQNRLPDDDQFGRDFLPNKKPSQAHPSDGRPLDCNPTPNIKETDYFEFEQWPHVTRFRIRKTSLRRGVITGSSRPRQTTD